MAPTTARQGSQAWKPWAALGFASLSLAALSAQPASAVGTYGLDNTGDQMNPNISLPQPNTDRFGLSVQQRFMRTFKMGNFDAYLKDVIVGYSVTGATAQDLQIDVFEVTNTQPFVPVPPYSGTAPFNPGTVLASDKFSAPGTNGGTGATWFNVPVATSALANFLFQAGKNYGFSFWAPMSASGSGPLGLRHCNSAQVTAGCPGSTFTTAGGITIPISGTSLASTMLNGNTNATWGLASATVQTAYMEINFTPVPAPALMGFSSLSGLMVYSRRLRSRIKGSVA